MIVLLNFLYALAGICLMPFLLWRMLTQNRYRRGWKHRFGYVPTRTTRRPCLWIHAVSMGEINASGTLIRELERFLPGYDVVISTTTDTGYDRAKSVYGNTHQIFFFPWDFSPCVRRAFDRIQPDLCILMELEVWHNFTAVAANRNIPVIVANGRISSGKGFPRYKKIAPLVRPMFRRLTLVLAQDKAYAERFAYLGVPENRNQIVGSLKYDTATITDSVEGTSEMARQLLLSKTDPIWVCGSTGAGEESMLLDAFGDLYKEKQLKGLRLILVPRKPERFEEVARLIRQRGLGLIRYSEVKTGEYPVTKNDSLDIILGDTMGDLRKFYSLAEVIFVGRSLVPQGGSDMMEAAGLGKPGVVGPYTENFDETVQAMVSGGGIEIVADTIQLSKITRQLFLNPSEARSMGLRGREVILQNQGATRRTVTFLAGLLGYQMPPSDVGVGFRAAKTDSAS